MTKGKLKPFPELASNEAAERFDAEADLSNYDWSDMKPVRFEFATKTKPAPEKQD